MLRPMFFFLKWLLLLVMVVPVVRAAIADAARTRGQDDDITALTIARVGA